MSIFPEMDNIISVLNHPCGGFANNIYVVCRSSEDNKREFIQQEELADGLIYVRTKSVNANKY